MFTCPGGVQEASRWCPRWGPGCVLRGVQVVSRRFTGDVQGRSKWCPGGVQVVSRRCTGGVQLVSRWLSGSCLQVVSRWCLGGVCCSSHVRSSSHVCSNGVKKRVALAHCRRFSCQSLCFQVSCGAIWFEVRGLHPQSATMCFVVGSVQTSVAQNWGGCFGGSEPQNPENRCST